MQASGAVSRVSNRDGPTLPTEARLVVTSHGAVTRSAQPEGLANAGPSGAEGDSVVAFVVMCSRRAPMTSISIAPCPSPRAGTGHGEVREIAHRSVDMARSVTCAFRVARAIRRAAHRPFRHAHSPYARTRLPVAVLYIFCFGSIREYQSI